MKLIIVRHGEAEHNLGGLMVAGGESRLTEKGKAQVQRTAERLRDEPITAAFSSDSERALHTAQGILQFHPDLALKVLPALRERNMGEMEGKTREEFIADAKNSGVPWYEHKPKGGESMLETQARAQAFIESLWPQYRGKTVLISSHGGFIRALLTYLLHLTYDRDTPLRVLNTSISIVEVGDEPPHTAHLINDIGHLDSATAPIVR